ALELDSCCQVCHRLVMESLLAQGQPEHAIKQFERCSAVLQRELGVEPSIELLRVHQMALLKL
ncbi:MAG: bacterial transcriptional activator domain-containing protein, partial [Candidatus Eremiobacteraeota bacterium]|nr:bacterial transcriptional activator domain-containing protein [Candidatus Eremiobacteraeota bacterium]